MPHERRYANRPEMKALRRDLRNHATPAEKALWRLLQKRQLAGRKFRRQHSVDRYVLDFYYPKEQLAVELDGSVHADPARASYDAERQAKLEAFGIQVLRFENREVLRTPDVVAAAIAAHFQTE
jgi:very-short-patch-repair endonuclease